MPYKSPHGASKNMIKNASMPSQTVSRKFNCNPNDDIFQDMELNILYPENDNILMLTSPNLISIGIGTDFEEKFLKNNQGSGDTKDKFKSALDFSISEMKQNFKIKKDYKETQEGVLKFYQETLRTSINKVIDLYSDVRFRPLVPKFGISYLNINEDDYIESSYGVEHSSFGKISSVEKINEGLDSGTLITAIYEMFKFKFIPHEMIGLICEIISALSKDEEYVSSYNYYTSDEVLTKDFYDIYKNIALGEEVDNVRVAPMIEKFGAELLFLKIMNYIIPSERVGSFKEDDTVRLGFFTVIGSKGYLKTPIISDEGSFEYDRDFNFSSKRPLLFSFKMSNNYYNSIVMPYLYDKRRMDYQSSEDISLRDDPVDIFKSSADEFNFKYIDLEIHNGSFDKYNIVLSLCNISGLEDYPYPLIRSPYLSAKDHKDQKVSRSFTSDITEIDDVADAARQFRKFPKRNYSFETGFQMYDSDGFIRLSPPPSGSLTKSLANPSTLKSISSGFVENIDEYDTLSEKLTYVFIPFEHFGSNIDDVKISISRKQFKLRLPEEYSDRMSVYAKAYLVDEYGQYQPLLKKSSVKDNNGLRYHKFSNMYRFIIKDPIMDTLELIANISGGFSIVIEGNDLEFAETLVITDKNGTDHHYSLDDESVSLSGTRISISSSDNFFAGVIDDPEYSGILKFLLLCQSPSNYDSLESNILSKEISSSAEGNNVTETSTINVGDIVSESGFTNE